MASRKVVPLQCTDSSAEVVWARVIKVFAICGWFASMIRFWIQDLSEESVLLLQDFLATSKYVQDYISLVWWSMSVPIVLYSSLLLSERLARLINLSPFFHFKCQIVHTKCNIWMIFPPSFLIRSMTWLRIDSAPGKSSLWINTAARLLIVDTVFVQLPHHKTLNAFPNTHDKVSQLPHISPSS